MSVAAPPVRAGYTARHPALTGAVAVCVAAGASGFGGWVAAQLGMKGVLAAAAGLVFLAALVLVPRREEIVLATAVLSVAALFHKSFTELAEVSSGPPSIYVSSFDIMIGVLWFAWFLRGPYEMAAELRRLFRRPVMWLPIASASLMLPSVLTARDSKLAIAELVRMASMYLLFVFLAARIRDRSHVWIVLGALGTIAAVEFVVVAGQYFTTSSLGLSVFGTPTILHNRHDGVSVARPFGTMAHPVFMAAFMGPLALLAYSLAVNLRARGLKALCLVLAAAAVAPLIISNARAASLGIVVAFVLLSIALLVLGRLPGRTAAAWLLLAALAAVPAWPYLSDLWSTSFKTEHFSLEWESRVELNGIAIDMFEDKPFFGHGLNNFEQAMPHYDRFGLIFADNPVHNVYLLQLAETGVVGFAGMLVLAVPMFVLSVRLARSRDRLYSAIGFAVAAAYVFWAVEEFLVFSLRQDHPRALLFLLNGTVIACLRLAGLQRPARPWVTRAYAAPPPRPPRPAPSTRRFRAPAPAAGPPRRGNGLRFGRARRGPALPRAERLARRRVWRRVHAAGVAAVLVAGAGLAGAEPTPAASPTGGLRIVFGGTDRVTGLRSIYVAEPDGSIRRVSPGDGRQYSWPSWAYGGSKIVFTARRGDPGGAEPVYLMDADGTDEVQLTNNPWRNVHPQVTPDGRTVVFTSAWDEYPAVGIYRLDLETLQVRNLSAIHSETGALDSDPRVSADGRLIAFADGRGPGGTAPAQVGIMNVDGTGRRLVTADGFFNTDPALSPGNGQVAIARYVGEGSPAAGGGDQFQVKLYDFVLVVRDLGSGAERILTKGEHCAERPLGEPCTPEEAPAYTPRWLPDGTGVGYVGVLGPRTTCVCLVSADGSEYRAVVQRDDIAINWFDWIVPGSAPDVSAMVGTRVPASRLLFSGSDRSGRPVLGAAMPDRFGHVPLAVQGLPLVPRRPRWSADRSKIVFSALAPYDPAAQAPPAPPPGQYRHRHYTLAWMQEFYNPPVDRAAAPFEQVFVMNGDGTGLRRVTTPVTEDFMDAVPDGELRGNVEPDISPDGRSVVVTNVSTATRESFLLRIDLQTGAVFNLTNATAGAMPVMDMNPRFSPDGGRVAFATSVGGTMQIAVIDAADGRNYREVTADDYLNLSPAWSPDGRYLVYTSYRGPADLPVGEEELMRAARAGRIPRDGWVLVRLDTVTGAQTVLTGPADSPAFEPVWSPAGDEIAFISLSGAGQPDIHVVGRDGGPTRPVQVTMVTDEVSVDWR